MSYIQIAQQQIDLFFESIVSYDKMNISRNINFHFKDIIKISPKRATKPNYFQFVMENIASEDEMIEIATFFLKFFQDIDLSPPQIIRLPDWNDQDDVNSFESEMADRVDELSNIMQLVSEPRKGKESLMDRSFYVADEVQFEDIPKIKDLINLYHSCYEDFIDKFLGVAYKKIKKIPLNKYVSHTKILEFFRRKWKDSVLFPYLQKFDPYIRNSIGHKKYNTNISNQTIRFWDTSRTEYKEVKIKEFLNLYYFQIQFPCFIASVLLPNIISVFEDEKTLISELKGISKAYVDSRKARHHPLFYMFKELYYLFCNHKYKFREKENLDKFVITFFKKLEECFAAEKETRLLPEFFRYTISDYPFKKPVIFKIELVKKYMRWVEIKLVEDDLDLLKGILEEFTNISP